MPFTFTAWASQEAKRRNDFYDKDDKKDEPDWFKGKPAETVPRPASWNKPKKKKQVKEDAPTNSMGLSSSNPATGAIDTYDPLLDLGGGKVKSKMRKKLFDILRRKLAEK